MVSTCTVIHILYVHKYFMLEMSVLQCFCSLAVRFIYMYALCKVLLVNIRLFLHDEIFLTTKISQIMVLVSNRESFKARYMCHMYIHI